MIGAGEALKGGFVHTWSRWPGTLLVAAAAIAESLAGLSLALAVFAGAQAGPGVFLWGAAGALAAGGLARLLGLAALAGSVRSGARWLRGAQEEAPFEAVWKASPRAAAFFAFCVPIDLAFFLWKWLGFGALVFGFFTALGKDQGAVTASAALALFGALTVVLWGLDLLWRRTALVRAVVHDKGVATSLLEALRLVGERPFARAGAVGGPLLIGAAAVVFFNLLAGVLGQAAGDPAIELQVASELASGLPSAVALAVCELIALVALAALDLPQGDM